VIAHRVEVAENTVRAIAKRFIETGGDVEATIGREQRATPPMHQPPSPLPGLLEATVY
jgi:hypothetical protein